MGNNELRRQASGSARQASNDGTAPVEGGHSGVAVPPGFWHRIPPSASALSSSPSSTGGRMRPPLPVVPTDHRLPPNEPPTQAPANPRMDMNQPNTVPLLQDAERGESGSGETEGSGVDHSASFHENQAKMDAKYKIAVYASLVANILLFLAKIYAFTYSGSQAVLASMADSAVDLASQGVLGLASWQMRKEDPDFPIGKTRLETLGVIACAIIMGLASFEVLASAATQLWKGFAQHQYPTLEFGALMYIILGATTALKIPLYFYCCLLEGSSASMGALAEDHRNDVLANMTALVTAGIASWNKDKLWMVDPIGAVLISLYIMWSWALITKEQLDKLVGHRAPDEFLDEVKAMASTHHDGMGVDVVRAYHFGERYTVEVEVVLPGDMSVMQSHDIALDLQHKIEALEDVERAHVHVDYQTRDKPEHKVDRNLNEGWHLNQPHPDYVYITQQGSARDGGVMSPERNNSTGSSGGGS
mmetsp:Transcript_23683/g.42094  ORF Transcript_23683/g.42094 Transcript_23683/m.42094 type:complete len:475 (-) Transcript_23683:80-1504(-)